MFFLEIVLNSSNKKITLLNAWSKHTFNSMNLVYYHGKTLNMNEE